MMSLGSFKVCAIISKLILSTYVTCGITQQKCFLRKYQLIFRLSLLYFHALYMLIGIIWTHRVLLNNIKRVWEKSVTQWTWLWVANSHWKSLIQTKLNILVESETHYSRKLLYQLKTSNLQKAIRKLNDEYKI